MELAKRIRSIREAKGITFEKICELLGVSRTAYVGIESNSEGMTLANLQAISAALDVPLAELLGIEPTTITEVQAVGTESVLRFQKKKAAFKAAVKIYLDTDRFDRRQHDILNDARNFEIYLDGD